MVILLEIESKLNFLFNDNNLIDVGATYAILATPTQFGQGLVKPRWWVAAPGRNLKI